MLLDSLAKAFHALVRQSLLKWMTPRRLPCQMGGFSGTADTLCHAAAPLHYTPTSTAWTLKWGFVRGCPCCISQSSAWNGLWRNIGVSWSAEAPTITWRLWCWSTSSRHWCGIIRVYNDGTSCSSKIGARNPQLHVVHVVATRLQLPDASWFKTRFSTCRSSL